MKMPSNNRVRVEGWKTAVAAIALLAAPPLAAAAVQTLEGDATIYCDIAAPYLDIGCDPSVAPIRNGECCYLGYAKNSDSVTTHTSEANRVTATVSWTPSELTNKDIQIILVSVAPCNCTSDPYYVIAAGPSPLTASLQGEVVRNANLTLALMAPYSCNYQGNLLNLIPHECRTVPVSIVRNQSVHYVLTVES